VPTSERVQSALPRAESFDEVAELYERARPTYPQALVADLIALTRLQETHRVLEIGAGTGQLTVSLARQGIRLIVVERGANLARVLAQNVAAFPQVTIVVADFDKWDTPSDHFDSVVVATAFHWLDPSTRLRKCARLLRPGGTLAIVDTRWGAGMHGDRFAQESQACYAQWDPRHDPNFRPLGPDDVPEFSEELEKSGLFEAIVQRRYFCQREYKARAYCDLLAIFSNVLAFDVVRRNGFLQCIERLVEDRFAGSIVRADVHDLWVGRTPT
jgi:SAM-dependent methyltransferase